MTSPTLADISAMFTEETLDEIIGKAGGVPKHTSYRFGRELTNISFYTSKVFELCVCGVHKDTGKNMEVNLIVKSIPDDNKRRSLLEKVNFFHTEISFQKSLEALEASGKAEDAFEDYPRMYASCCDGVNDFMALEDMKFRD